MSDRSPLPDLSFVIPVRNVEEDIGHRVRAIAGHLRSLGVPFEIIAVNDGSTDNSFAILRLLSATLPELRILTAEYPGRAYIRGASEARGGVILLADCERPAPLAPLRWAMGRLAAGRDAVILRGRYIVARRLPVLTTIARAGGRGPAFERNFEQRGSALRIEVVGTAPRRPGRDLLEPVFRMLAV